MPPIVRLPTSWKIGQIIGMCISDEIVLDLIEFVFIVVILVFIFVDLGFDIEELISTFASTLSTMALKAISMYAIIEV